MSSSVPSINIDPDGQLRFAQSPLRPTRLLADYDPERVTPSELVEEATVLAYQSDVSPQTLSIMVDVPDGVTVRLIVNDADYEVHTGSEIVGLPASALRSLDSTDVPSVRASASGEGLSLEFVCPHGGHRVETPLEAVLDSGNPICVVDGCPGFDAELEYRGVIR